MVLCRTRKKIEINCYLALGGMYLKIYQFAEKMVKKDQYIVSYCTHEKIKFEGFPENGC